VIVKNQETFVVQFDPLIRQASMKVGFTKRIYQKFEAIIGKW
jgi:hypothetical protein